MKTTKKDDCFSFPYRLSDEQHHILQGVADTLYTLVEAGRYDDPRNEQARVGCLAMLSDNLEKLLDELSTDSKQRWGKND